MKCYRSYSVGLAPAMQVVNQEMDNALFSSILELLPIWDLLFFPFHVHIEDKLFLNTGSEVLMKRINYNLKTYPAAPLCLKIRTGVMFLEKSALDM